MNIGWKRVFKNELHDQFARIGKAVSHQPLEDEDIVPVEDATGPHAGEDGEDV